MHRMLSLRRLSLKGFLLQFSVSLISSSGPAALSVRFRSARPASRRDRTPRLSLSLAAAGSLRLGLRGPRRERKRGFQLLKALLWRHCQRRIRMRRDSAGTQCMPGGQEQEEDREGVAEEGEKPREEWEKEAEEGREE